MTKVKARPNLFADCLVYHRVIQNIKLWSLEQTNDMMRAETIMFTLDHNESDV